MRALTYQFICTVPNWRSYFDYFRENPAFQEMYSLALTRSSHTRIQFGSYLEPSIRWNQNIEV